MTIKVFRIEHSATGFGLYCTGAAEAYDEAIGVERGHVGGDVDSLWNTSRCPVPTHENENPIMNAPPPCDIQWLFAFASKKAMMAWAPSFEGRSKLVELGLVLTTYEVMDREALIVGRFQCAFDVDRARPTRTTPLITQRERREQC